MPTETGRAALAQYQESIIRVQETDRGREGMSRLQRAWADQFKVDPQDALILGEFAVKDRLPREVQDALADCGVTLREVQASVDRLFTSGLLGAVGGSGPIPQGKPAEALLDDD